MGHKKIFLLLGNTDPSGLDGMLADAYEDGARSAGHTVERLDIGEMQFDPILHKGYREIQAIEPDLKRFQELMQWCDHFVIVYPVWWANMPAMLVGLFDRAWLPGTAFRYIKTKSGKRTMFWHRLYRGKTARTILTSGSPSWLVRLLPGSVNAQLKWGILWFAGFRTRSTWFGHAETTSDVVKTRWREYVHALGKKAR